MAKKDDAIWGKWFSRLTLSKQQRTIWEAQVATTSHFAAGLQRYWWDEYGNLREKRLLPHEIWRTINLCQVSLNILQSRLTMNDPHWTPKKSPSMGDVSDKEMQAANALLQAVWDGTFHSDLSLKRILKLGIRKGYIEGGALFYHRFDEQYDMPCVDLFSLWDTYSDRSAEDIYNKEWIGFRIPQGIEWMKRQTGWKIPADLAGDGQLAESQYKQDFMTRKTGNATNIMPESRLLLYAFEYENSNIVFRVIDRSYGVLYEQNMSQYTSLCDLFTVFHPIDTGDFYARPPMMDWIDPQKTINKIYSSIECYIDTFGQGKWLLEDESVTVPIAGAHGQKIYARPEQVAQLRMEPLPQTHFAHLEQAIKQFEQISGVHSESLGRQSGSADSGKALGQLQALDEQNSNDQVDNFKMCMQQIGCKILRDASENWDDMKTLYHYDQMSGQHIPIKVMGERAYKSRTHSRDDDAIPLRAFDMLGVEIVIGKYFSKTQKMENLTTLLGNYQPGQNRTTDRIVLPILVEAFDIGVGDDIVKELRKLEDPNLMIMDGKAMLIADGTRVIINASDDHAAYAQYYQQKAKEYQQGGDMKSANLLNAQASLHLQMLKEQQDRQGGAAMPQAPESLGDAAAQTSAHGGTLPIAGNDIPSASPVPVSR